MGQCSRGHSPTTLRANLIGGRPGGGRWAAGAAGGAEGERRLPTRVHCKPLPSLPTHIPTTRHVLYILSSLAASLAWLERVWGMAVVAGAPTHRRHEAFGAHAHTMGGPRRPRACMVPSVRSLAAACTSCLAPLWIYLVLPETMQPWRCAAAPRLA